MSKTDDVPEPTGGHASPPCMAHEIDPAYAGLAPPDPQQIRDVARWRKAEREVRLAARRQSSAGEHSARSAQIVEHLLAFLEREFDGGAGHVLSAYWPIKGEPNLRQALVRLHEAGVTVALPIVETKAAPLVFRVWTPETKMVRGDWNIPVPPADAPRVVPTIALAPLVGWDGDGYRLGYGGGYFDRTLANLDPMPFSIGIGYASARIATIYPQTWDVRLSAILTEDGFVAECGATP